jgi:hypothetical protein
MEESCQRGVWGRRYRLSCRFMRLMRKKKSTEKKKKKRDEKRMQCNACKKRKMGEALFIHLCVSKNNRKWKENKQRNKKDARMSFFSFLLFLSFFFTLTFYAHTLSLSLTPLLPPRALPVGAPLAYNQRLASVLRQCASQH